MPNYKTHSIHGELVLPEIDKKVDIKKEDLKAFCMGPDAMILTDYKTFDYQHANKTRDFFITMLKLIKENKLVDNIEVMAYVYGQIDHFVLDTVMHPLIYYMTEDIKNDCIMKPHGLVENWIDDYVIQKYHRTDTLYYHKWYINNQALMNVINELYIKVYGVRNESLKYSLGMFTIILFDIFARRNLIGIVPLILKIVNLGDFLYKDDFKRVIPYLNIDNEVWYNPETQDAYQDSFDDLWKKSIEMALDTIEDVNRFLYQDKELKSKLILNDTSWNTGLACEKGQSLKYVKKYK